MVAATIAPKLTAEEEVLLTTTLCGVLGVPTLRVVLKAIVAGATAIGLVAVPVTVTLSGEPIPL